MSPEVKLPTALVVEDEEKISHLVESDLTEAGYKVYPVKSARAGVELHLERINKGLPHFDAIVTDNNTDEEGDGTKLLRLHPHAQNIPILVISSDTEGAIVKVNFLHGLGWPIGFLAKPFNLGDVPARLDELQRELIERNNPTDAA